MLIVRLTYQRLWKFCLCNRIKFNCRYCVMCFVQGICRAVKNLIVFSKDAVEGGKQLVVRTVVVVHLQKAFRP